MNHLHNAPEAAPRADAPKSKANAVDRLAAAGLDPMLCLDDIATLLLVSRRAIERLKAAGKLPKPDLTIGRMPRWKPETIRRWIAQQAKGREVNR